MARRVLALLYKEGEAYRIPFGPLKGLRLHYDRAINYHAVLGLWDLEAFDYLKDFVREGMVVADVGANIGLFSLWAARRGTRVYAFEPAPYAVGILRKNLELNHIDSVEIAELACSDRKGEIDFFLGHHHHASSLLPGWASDGGPPTEKLIVPTETLDGFFADRGYPDFIKMDIEGGGVLALEGMEKCLTSKRPLVWIESHTPDEDSAISRLCLRHGYQAYRLQTRSLVENLRATHPDKTGVWGTLLLFPFRKPGGH